VREYLVLRVVTKLLLPPILLFALYVQFHGDYGAGGGFQAGVIFASGVVLYALIFDYDLAIEVLTPGVMLTLVPTGVLLYGAVGLASLARGGHYLEYAVLVHDPRHGQHLGILLVEAGVGITVAAVMMGIFLAFLRHWHEQP
jgi:multicomponent Na+:H+ antiporter subunit B